MSSCLVFTAILLGGVMNAPPVAVLEVGVAEGSTCARRADGTVACWGALAGNAARPREIPELLGVVDLDLGRRHACAVRDDGTVWCWGANDDGQLGDGTHQDREAPVLAVGLHDAVEVVADRMHTCARRRSGAVMCWGRAALIGDGGLTDRAVPTPVRRLRDARQLVAGDDVTCAIRGDRSAWCWGFNTTGLLNPKLGPVLAPRPVTWLEGVDELALGWRHGCVTLTDLPHRKDRPARQAEGLVSCFGDDSRGQLGDQWVPNNAYCHGNGREVTCTWRPPPPDRSDERRAIARNREYRPPPDPPEETRVFPERPGGVLARAMHLRGLAASDGRSCGLRKPDGVVCWGRGYATPEWSFHRPSAIPGTVGATQVAVEQRHGCAVLNHGDVACWGDNRSGALGDATTTSRAEARPVEW